MMVNSQLATNRHYLVQGSRVSSVCSPPTPWHQGQGRVPMARLSGGGLGEGPPPVPWHVGAGGNYLYEQIKGFLIRNSTVPVGTTLIYI